MKTVFIINPTAGKKSGVKRLVNTIHQYFEQHPADHEICIAKRPGDSTKIARQFASSGEPVRLLACGGDGTTFAVLNGMAGYDNAILGVIPKGTGNDFLRTFGNEQVFRDIDNQMKGNVCRLDAIKANDYLCINQASMGMDANVCANKDKFNKIPLVKGQVAYTLSLLYCFFTKLKSEFTIQIDDQPPISGDYLFAIAANGQCYGGGFHSAPLAHPADGKLDCVTITPVSRLKILSLIKQYSAGNHLTLPICHYERCHKLTVTSTQKTPVNLDGEVIYTHTITFELLPAHINFNLPQGATLPNTATKSTQLIHA